MRYIIEGLLWAGAINAGVLLLNACLCAVHMTLAVVVFWISFICLIIQGGRLIINGGRHWEWFKK